MIGVGGLGAVREERAENRIRDAIHGFIRFDEREKSVIDSPEFQRLRRVKQLATTHYVYPGAMHTRFEHSLGVMELVTRMFYSLKRNSTPSVWTERVVKSLEAMGLGEEGALRAIRLAALLHDIGHPPFSHAAEGLFPKDIRHEHVSVAVVRSMQNRINAAFGPRMTEWVIQLIHPDPSQCSVELRFLRTLISGQLDADRCDYLLRDSHHCGVTYGTYDLDRLLDSIMVVEDPDGAVALAIDRGGVHVVESLILARYYMFSQVYFHRTRRLFDYYLGQFMSRVMPRFGPENLTAVLEWDDERVMSEVRARLDGGPEEVRTFARRLWFRDGDVGKHSVVFETHDFAGQRLAHRLAQEVERLRAEFRECEIFADLEARGRIHRFYKEGDPEDGDPLWVVTDRRKNSLSLLTKQSRVVSDMPRWFWVMRVYARKKHSCLEELRSRLQHVTEG